MAGLKSTEKPSKREKVNKDNVPNLAELPEASESDGQEEGELSGDELTREGNVSATTRRLQMQQETVQRIILEAKESHSRLLDLTRKGLKEIPTDLLLCKNVQFLYLEGNDLTKLPDNFFDCLENLQWVDIRNNYLTSIPTAYISRHQYLRTILLEGNQLRTLPLELGLVSTLHGLNIANNPMEFPPQEIIERGTQGILAFFREILKAKSEGKIPPVPRIEELQFNNREEVYSSSSDEGGFSFGTSHATSGYNKQKSKSSKGVRPTLSKQGTQGSFYGSLEDLVGPVPQSAALHKPTSYHEIRQQQIDKLQKAGVLQQREKSKSSKTRRKLPRDVDVYPPPPDPTMVEERYADERRLAKLRELKEKQDLILQRRKDADKLKAFRDDSKRMQRDKQMEKMRKGGKLDYDEPAEQAPFGIDQEDLKMMSNEERIAQDIKAKHEKIRQRPMSPRSLQKMEQARAERDKELEKRIKHHTIAMQDRRQKPKGTPQQEMEAAMRELEVAESLQRELDARRRDLEYRFTAFTGEPVISRPARPSKIQH